MAKKKQVSARYDSNRTRLKTGESQRPNGTYVYRWTTADGKRHATFAVFQRCQDIANNPEYRVCVV